MPRPAGCFNKESHSPAVLGAARQLATSERAPTRREIAAHLMLSTREIANTVDNLTRTGKLLPVRLRQVAHRTRPVAEYAPAPDLALEASNDAAAAEQDECRHGHCWVDLGRIVGGWAR